jgi:hypothetical protein
MPLNTPPIKAIPSDVRLLSRYFRQTQVIPDPDSVGPTQIQALGVTTAKVANSAITADKIDTAAVSTAKIADANVTFAKIQNVSGPDKILGRSSVGAGAIEEIDCTAAGRALLDDATAADQRTTLGLGTAATQNTGTSGATVPLLDGVNVHASGQFTAFGVGTTATQQAANPDTSGAALGALEVELNEIKAVLRAFGLIAP